ncbi:uncharacterized protein C8R40DRAFT_1068010 [Lentinula edodes]|uniref:uncharacterized protein n=1 Tax=Lentinula edodes TaxID=5353 RepID=UPI001E8CB1D4|nr:uncharacterized protein C8R40DRAFT_1068010 [Lentinula edodes]KAH7877287.1 hypothetical protein C8R40DRAFT_1068010 [Lentinula edodes]KAJ3911283.1 hypothetical protein F5877DRAFT_86199 [Lentinula edodes]
MNTEDEVKGLGPRDFINGILTWQFMITLHQVTTLYVAFVPEGLKQICCYDNETGAELELPLATTVSVFGQAMFQLLPSSPIRAGKCCCRKYVPHTYVRMGLLGIGSESRKAVKAASFLDRG